MSDVNTVQRSPVRIYVLWHPEFQQGLTIARRIYHWFRLENMEGIPVFFRSMNERGKEVPPSISNDCLINYVIPLVEANMVADPTWRRYVAGYGPQARPAGQAVGRKTRKPEPVYRMFPVAVDPVAYQMPAALRQLNFIRHNLGESPAPDMERLISQLTEVLCRDLRRELHAEKSGRTSASGRSPDKLKVFLSHAKADGTRTPIALKEYIQGQTQCEAFFDETDIASGYDYTEVLEQAISEDSAGLVVVQGDHYADRPWCRKEIRDFLRPVTEFQETGRKPSKKHSPAFFIPPVAVVYNMEGKRIGRTIPELGHAPCLRWQEGHQRLIVTTLLREILLGLFYRHMAATIARSPLREGCVVINRSPDPVMVDRILHTLRLPDKVQKTIVHPGYGLSQLEKQGLKESFPNVAFAAFSELTSTDFPNAKSGRFKTRKGNSSGGRNLQNVVLAVSVGQATDIQCAGMADEHLRELMVRVLRPLFRAGISLLYGGTPPPAVKSSTPWKDKVDFTETFMELLLSERGERTGSRLYNLSAWPHSDKVDRHLKARWTDICSFITVSQEEAGIAREEWKDGAGAVEDPSPEQSLNTARCLSAMRQTAVGEISVRLPDEATVRRVGTRAHIFAGGSLAGTGRMPGVLEELDCALEAGKPIFLIGITQGAAGLVARWFLKKEFARRKPVELHTAHYSEQRNFRSTDEALKQKGLEDAGVVFERLWKRIKQAHESGSLDKTFRNGLTHAENVELLETDHFGRIAELIGNGIANLTARANRNKR